MSAKKYEFHGSFTDKDKAVIKEKEVGGYIIERRISGKVYYFVMTRKDVDS